MKSIKYTYSTQIYTIQVHKLPKNIRSMRVKGQWPLLYPPVRVIVCQVSSIQLSNYDLPTNNIWGSMWPIKIAFFYILTYNMCPCTSFAYYRRSWYDVWHAENLSYFMKQHADADSQWFLKTLVCQVFLNKFLSTPFPHEDTCFLVLICRKFHELSIFGYFKAVKIRYVDQILWKWKKGAIFFTLMKKWTKINCEHKFWHKITIFSAFVQKTIFQKI